MFYKRVGFPEENDLVQCTVTNVQYHSVFCTIDDYKKTGLIHISEVSPGRIRNIRDFVVEGKKVICKILKIDRDKGHIDLSLRRVTESERRKKNETIKQEMKAEKIIENLSAELGKNVKEVYPAISKPILEEYEYLHEAFEDYVDEEINLDNYNIPKDILEPLEKSIKEKIKPKKVVIQGKITISTYVENGIEVIKEALIKAGEVNKEQININYLGNATYKIVVESEEYKEAEKTLNQALEIIEKIIEKNKGEYSFVRA